MSYRDRLTKASFRGFDFLTESHDAKSGRKLVVHEYPHADQPEVEDFGLKAKSWHISAYFIGENYDLEANGFLAKLAISGAAWLTHPWLGELWVRAQDWSRSESNDKNGYCVISVEFIAGGHAPYSPKIDPVDKAYSRVHELSLAALDDFSLVPMSNDGFNAFITNTNLNLEALRNVISLTTLPLNWANQALNVLYGIKNDVNVLMQVPGQYAAALVSFADVLGFGGDTAGNAITGAVRSRAVTRLANTAINPPLITIIANTAVTAAAPFKTNSKREAALRSQLLVVAAAQMALADYDTAESRDSVLNSLLTAIDSLLPAMSDNVFQAAVSARMALIDALLDQDLNLAIQRDIVNPLPSTLLAHQMGVDEAVFIAQNGIKHPLFVVGRIYA
ncbi:MAG: DNA circularization N-terminal domain-containing protein [Methylotenera sp.]|nr:DNA circularization N-terminal domain-containing protein [Methylotenera sp.]